MWRNYLTVGIRSLAKNRAYALINILGLAIGMAACLMILLFVRYELSYDRFLPGVEDTYELQSFYTSKQTGQKFNIQMTAYVAGERLKKDFPQVDKTVFALSGSPVILKDGQSSMGEDVILVDGPFFDVVRFPFVKGNPATALAEAGAAVITEKEAVRQFGTTDVMGRTLTMVSRGRATDYRITGVIKDVPKNSSFRLSIVGRIDFPSFFSDAPDFMREWGWQSGWFFFTLRPGTDPKAIAAQLPAWEKRNIPDQDLNGIRYNAGDEQDWRIVNLADIHLGEAQGASMSPGNDRRAVYTFGLVALLILGMACVNFTNLATARASQRAREVALRKVLGASRRDLIVQFIGESILVAAIAMLVALALTEIALPYFSRFLDADLKLHYFGQGGILLPVVALVLLVGLAGGLYPAFFLSRFQPARVLKANRSASEAEGSGRLRGILVVAQFAVSIGLIICTGVIYAQTVYAQTADPGYHRDGILQIDNFGRRQLDTMRQPLRDAIARIDGVTGVAATSIGVATRNNSSRGIQVPGRADLVNLGTYVADPEFFDVMGIKLIAGRKLDRNRTVDDATVPFPSDPVVEAALAKRGVNAVINQLAARRLGFTDPADAVGKQVRTSMVESEDYGLTPVNIVGVVEDTRFRSVRTPIDPLMFTRNDNAIDVLDVRYHGNPAEVRSRIERVWKQMAPDVPFEAEFSEDIVRELYQAETARAKMFAAFAILAVIVGCLGLFGLATFTAERRTKEIGIRKVLGARTRDIVRLLVWQFSKPVLVANLVAWPIAWWVMRNWLNEFDSRITLGPAPFLLAGLLALLIAIATIGSHAFRVARANPVHALRYE
ncbi:MULTISPECIES: ABC transporter permease [Sphingomonadales]|uniref:ABC transporter permease n=2 Tax=Edaphosphingomonas TaxID=3423724 RepID=A0A2T4I8K1_9SPHN|nr:MULTISPECIES: ABC transporter permease [Sphingomonas]AGH49798.1 putative ABC transporter permease [Sphingomonas sp. MM-1]MDX3885796.1 ABC transporter permease [Sphingomonas sp.]OHT18114.1 Macrolide export ATP-binding/permease protein MacB [Sphingomonas haloaromaticamans]PTD28078.1 ABC transporter permease [Sphingomonas fennica]